jgi:hypothetical protein
VTLQSGILPGRKKLPHTGHLARREWGPKSSRSTQRRFKRVEIAMSNLTPWERAQLAAQVPIAAFRNEAAKTVQRQRISLAHDLARRTAALANGYLWRTEARDLPEETQGGAKVSVHTFHLPSDERGMSGLSLAATMTVLPDGSIVFGLRRYGSEPAGINIPIVFDPLGLGGFDCGRWISTEFGPQGETLSPEFIILKKLGEALSRPA